MRELHLNKRDIFSIEQSIFHRVHNGPDPRNGETESMRVTLMPSKTFMRAKTKLMVRIALNDGVSIEGIGEVEDLNININPTEPLRNTILIKAPTITELEVNDA